MGRKKEKEERRVEGGTGREEEWKEGGRTFSVTDLPWSPLF